MPILITKSNLLQIQEELLEEDEINITDIKNLIYAAAIIRKNNKNFQIYRVKILGILHS